MSLSQNQHILAHYSERARSDPVNTNYQFTNQIEAVQYNAALAFAGCIRGCISGGNFFSEFGLTSLLLLLIIIIIDY